MREVLVLALILGLAHSDHRVLQRRQRAQRSLEYLRFRSEGVFKGLEGTSDVDAVSDGGLHQWIVHVDTALVSPDGPEMLRRILVAMDVAQDFRIGGYFGKGSYRVMAQRSILKVEEHEWIQQVQMMDIAQRMHATFHQPDGSLSKTLLANIFPGFNLESVVNKLRLELSENLLLVRQVSKSRIALDLVDSSESLVIVVKKILKTVPHITFIQPKMRFSTLNKHAKRSTQSIGRNRSILHENGLLGDGQIVAHGDSGVDYDMCFFNDVNHTVPIDTVNLEHRKVVIFRQMLQNDSGRKNFHGTHTAATIAGNIAFSHDSNVEKSLKPYNGMAPNAKLSIYDLGYDADVRFIKRFPFLLPLIYN